ncbi:MAG: cohesin domain-containing protein [Candidatus Parcubacteria bacterium]|nr:cohesin domain-containing protein [Candidatus Parcubacteria bacterium]
MKKALFIFIIFFIASFGIASVARAESASLYLSPHSGTFYVGSTFDVSIFVNTEDNSINALDVNLKFSQDKLQVTSPTAGSSFISIWVDQPFYSNQDGIISFKGGVPSPGINTSAGLVSTITFRVKAPGTAFISFSDSSQVLLADGKGTNILKTATMGEYKLTIPPPDGPKIFYTSHPSLTSWYRNNNPTFSWEKEIGVNDFSYSLSQDPGEIPDNVSEGPLTSVTFNDIKDGIWYFHLKVKKENVWGGVSHYPLQIDKTPPKNTILNVEKIGRITGSRFFANFSADDLLSGIDHYELSLVNISNPQEGASPFFIEVVSPYRIPYELSGKYTIMVRFYDKAGNYSEVQSVLNIISPLISYTEKGISLGSVFLPWWLVYLLIGIFFIVVGWEIYHVLIRKNLAKSLKREVAEAEKEIEDVRILERKIRETRTLEEETKEEMERLGRKLKNKEETDIK